MAEALLAGGGVAARFANLRLPWWSPPLWLWAVIGIAYYATCFTLAYRLMTFAASRPRNAALLLLVSFMAANAAWNLVFFRYENLAWAFGAFLPYIAIVLALWAALWRFDRFSAIVFLPYVIYLGYAASWSYALWRANN